MEKNRNISWNIHLVERERCFVSFELLQGKNMEVLSFEDFVSIVQKVNLLIIYYNFVMKNLVKYLILIHPFFCWASNSQLCFYKILLLFKYYFVKFICKKVFKYISDLWSNVQIDSSLFISIGQTVIENGYWKRGNACGTKSAVYNRSYCFSVIFNNGGCWVGGWK